jgi:hypothetical protein
VVAAWGLIDLDTPGCWPGNEAVRAEAPDARWAVVGMALVDGEHEVMVAIALAPLDKPSIEEVDAVVLSEGRRLLDLELAAQGFGTAATPWRVVGAAS